jgi:hypothetical protein
MSAQRHTAIVHLHEGVKIRGQIALQIHKRRISCTGMSRETERQTAVTDTDVYMNEQKDGKQTLANR